MMPRHSVISELEDAVRSGSSAKRVKTLRQVTNLFLHDGARLNDEQIKVFDDVLCLLVSRVETRARAELGKSLAPVEFAPNEIIQRLARDDEISVAGQVLTNSKRVTTSTLVEVACSRGQDHLFAISNRTNLPAAVTDVLVGRGEKRVIRNLAINTTAQFSDTGYAGMVAHAEADDELTEIMGLRIDLPIKFLRDLLRRATEAVRARLTAAASPQLQDEIGRVLKAIADMSTYSIPENDYTRADEIVKRMKGLNELTDKAIASFAETNRFNEVAAALALLNNVPTDMMAKVIDGPRNDLVLIPCKSAGLNWLAVESILHNRPVKPKIDEETLKVAWKDYSKLSSETARRTLHFWQLHDKIVK